MALPVERPRVIPLALQAPKGVAYEFPLTERFRLFLRFQALSQAFLYQMKGGAPFSSLAALETLFDLLSLLKEGELRVELLCELRLLEERLRSLGGRLEGEILEALQEALRRTVELRKGLQEAPKFPAELKSGWLEQFRARRYLPSPILALDLPPLQRWLHLAPERRQQDLERWSAPLRPYLEGIDHLLFLLRESREPVRKVARGGLFEEELRERVPMVRVTLPSRFEGHPELVANRHRLIFRFLQERGGETVPVSEDLPFDLTLCGL